MPHQDNPITLADLIGSTSAAQPLDQALENIRVRRRKLLRDAAPQAADTAIVPEPIPVLDNPNAFATDFWQRKLAEKTKSESPKGKPTKVPHLTVHEGDDQPKKK